MKRRSFLFLIVLLMLSSLLDAGINILQESDSELVLEYTLDQYSLSLAGDFTALTSSDMSSQAVIGAPDIPYAEFKVGIPFGAGITYSIVSSESKTLTLDKPIRPIPKVSEKDGISVNDYLPESALYTGLTRDFVVELSPAIFRGYSFIPIELHPFSYNGDRTLAITSKAVIRIEIQGDTKARRSSPPDELAGSILEQLVNTAQAKNWYQSFRPAINFADFSLSDWWVRIETDKDGMFKITPSQLSALPLADIDPRSFRLFTTGGAALTATVVQSGPSFNEVSIQVVGEADGVFNSSDYIVFYGTDRNSLEQNTAVGYQQYYNPYSSNNVYWLTFGEGFPGSPKRMVVQEPQIEWGPSTTAYTETLRLDEERYRRDITGFKWYMTRMFGYNTADYQFQINLDHVDTFKAQTLTFSIIQENIDTYQSHSMSVYINDVPVISSVSTNSIIFSWSATSEYLFNKTVTGFVSGTNTIKIRIYRTGTLNYYLDYVKLDYGRRIEKTDGQLRVPIPTEYPLQVVRYELHGDYANALIYQVESYDTIRVVPLQQSYFVSIGAANMPFYILKAAEYHTPAKIELYSVPDLVTSLAQVDNVIICPQEFAASAQTLAGLYQQVYGKHSIVVDQQAIFDQFNGGHPDPVALRQYLRYIYHNAPAPAISSLTLLGLGSIDWVNTSGIADTHNKVILFQRNSDVSDDWFGMLTSSTYPEVAIGRYPVRNQTELNTMINNFISYTQNPQPGLWQNSLVFLADDLYNGPNSPYEDIHTDDMNSAARMMNPSVLIDKIFAWDYPYDEFQNKPGAREAMFRALNDGRLIWYYIGHGSYDKLGSEDYMNGATDMNRFTNVGKQSFFIAASCKVANFDYWGFDSLAQKVVLKPNTASIASWAATRITFPTLNDDLMKLALDRIVNKRNPVGKAILSTKLSYTQDSANELVYVLLGDPLLHIIPPERDSSMVVTGSVSGSATLHSREQANVQAGFSQSGLSGEAELIVFDSDREYNLDNVHVNQRGNKLFRGNVLVANSQFTGGFIVPDDVTNGNTGMVLAYLWDAQNKKSYISYKHPISLTDEAVAVSNDSPPSISLYLGSMDYLPGDTVGSTPDLIAKISDPNGINITGISGHNIIMVLDNALQPQSVTQYFSYDTNSFTTGTLRYRLPELTDGPHTVQLIAFDGFNLPSVASETFNVRKSGKLSLEQFLIYPNPMQNETSFTFILSGVADLKITVHSLSGKKIRTIETTGREGFNAIKWDGKDENGRPLANNTYFVKIRATDSEGNIAEKTERLVIYK